MACYRSVRRSFITPELLSSIRTAPNFPTHSYYFVVGATCSTLNLPQEIPKVLQYALEYGGAQDKDIPGHNEQLLICRKMREAIIKLAPIAGLPKVLSRPYRFAHTRD